MSVLEVTDLESGYGKLPVLHGVSLHVDANEIVAVAGPNGAGKSTLMKTIFRLLPVMRGSIVFHGHDVGTMTSSQLAELGMGFVPQGFGTFPDLTVDENLKVSLTGHGGRDFGGALELTYDAFPALKERRKQRARTLSGGERQMLSLASAMIVKPRFLALDEPTSGLAPTIMGALAEQILSFRDAGTTVLWVIEENPLEVLQYVDRVYLLQAGVIQRELAAVELLRDESLQELFFGTQADSASAAERSAS